MSMYMPYRNGSASAGAFDASHKDSLCDMVCCCQRCLGSQTPFAQGRDSVGCPYGAYWQYLPIH